MVQWHLSAFASSSRLFCSKPFSGLPLNLVNRKSWDFQTDMTLFTGHCLFPSISTWNLVSSCLSSSLLPAKHIWSKGNNTYNIIAEIFTTNTTAYTKYLYVPPHSTATVHAHGDMWLLLSNELWVELVCATFDLRMALDHLPLQQKPGKRVV